ncbi:hypothetical protein DFJ73DRAFT_798360 [Zopfochytrium polystomum]|nr:hypothetical protein DFJ73DRAFT_798360 [Zopfochytrium polystomum]
MPAKKAGGGPRPATAAAATTDLGSGGGLGAPGSKPKKKSGGDDEDASEVEMPVSSFQSYAAEGDILAKQGDFKKAIEAYTKALALRPSDKNGLVARSKCYLQLGDSEASLEDANMALREDPEFFKGVFQKAEALYAKGDFEMALVFYHRGNKLRPELDEFRLGIQKAREAIDNSIGNPKDYKFQAPTGVKFVQQSGSGPGGVSLKAPSSAGSGRDSVRREAKKDANAGSGKTVKQLLGELYADKEYLELLISDKDFINNPNDDIYSLVSDALSYLETRTEFWRQQKPIYARRKEHSKIQAKAISARNRQLIAAKAAEFQRRDAAEASRLLNPKTGGGYRPKTAPAASMTGGRAGGGGGGGGGGGAGAGGGGGGAGDAGASPAAAVADIVKVGAPPILPRAGPEKPFKSETEKSVLAVMNVINKAIDEGDLQTALNRAENLYTRVSDMRNLQNRDQYLSDITSTLGNICMEIGSLPQAIQLHRKDLAASRAANLDACILRALGNLGRVCVRLHRYDEAITAFAERLRSQTPGGAAAAAAATAAAAASGTGAVALQSAAAAATAVALAAANKAAGVVVSAGGGGRQRGDGGFGFGSGGGGSGGQRGGAGLGHDGAARACAEACGALAEAVKERRWALKRVGAAGAGRARNTRAATKAYTAALNHAKELADDHAVQAISAALAALAKA